MKWLLLPLAFVGLIAPSSAAEVTATQASQAAANWRGQDPALGCPLGRGVLATRACRTPYGACFYVVRLTGGGFVVMSSDTTQEPVIAFSSDGDLIEDERNPLWTLLCRDFDDKKAEASRGNARAAVLSQASAAPSAAERKWAKLLATAAAPGTTSWAAARTSVSDLRVAPFIESAWGQTTAGGVNCYNLLTPKNYYSGCVATAGAQIMRYFEWPRTAIPAFTNAYCAVDGSRVTLSAAGGTYDWSNMPLQPNARTPLEQRMAIASLLSDLGIACGMNYSASGSGTGIYMLSRAWTTLFGYGNATAYTLVGNLPTDAVRRALIANFDARLPVAIGISGPGDGHAIVGDGYGYSDGTLYYHLNMGWEGNSNAWYAPPDLSAGGYTFTAISSLVYNIFPERTSGNAICSGRVLNAAGVPIPGATVSATDYKGERCAETTTDERGIYALILPAAWAYPFPYTLHADYRGESADLSVKIRMSISTFVYADGTFNPDTAPAPAVNNLIDQNLTITAVAGVAAPVFSPAPGLFHPSVSVSIACATDGATIRYTTDGTEPTEESPLYSEPFTLTRTTTVKAKTFKPGLLPSPTVEVDYLYDKTLDAPAGDYFAHPIVLSSGAVGSHRLADTEDYTTEDLEPIHSLDNGQFYDQTRSAWYLWTAPGSGRMTFKVLSRKRIQSTTHYYHAMIAAYRGDDLRTIERIALFSGFATDGSTSLSFNAVQGETYRLVVFAHPSDPAGPYDLSWQGRLVTVRETQTTDVPVPYDWLSARYPGTMDFESQASAKGANGRPVWESYLLALDPTDPLSDLRITRLDFTNGLPRLGWNITNSAIRALGYDYRIKGKTALTDDWREPTAAHRFFRLFVEKNLATP